MGPDQSRSKTRTAGIIGRYFTKPDLDVYDAFKWRKLDAEITSLATGETVFRQEAVEFPESWSQNAVNIVSQKYFAGLPGSASRESSLRQLIDRVVDTITDQGLTEGYFDRASAEAETFRAELKHVLVSQRAAFNSPVWFNIGVEARSQQASACFILAVEDSMRSILNWYTEEGLIFQGGSGSGINLSPLRSSFEPLSGSGGLASGPVSFMRGADASAGSIASGGKTRRAAKMVVLNVDHPDIEDFIWCKAREERKSHALAAAGFDMGINGVDSASIQYQNANNSVRVTDDFMNAVVGDKSWPLKMVKTGEVAKTVSARQLWHQIAQAAWECADPGIQFDTTINDWHTTPNAGRINATNPCSEYMHIDNSACNLASINLLHFIDANGNFLRPDFEHVVDLMITAQEILVGYSQYPTDKIGRNARNFRQLGLGYANLGALIMRLGLAYDSEPARTLAAAITALMTGRAYLISARIAAILGPFAGYSNDSANTLRVLRKHRSAAREINPDLLIDGLKSVESVWDQAIAQAEIHGVRNAQATVLAPTGTISFMMDCDTTGIEPDIGLVKHKVLAGGGSMKLVNNSVGAALTTLGYESEAVDRILDYIKDNDTITGAPDLKSEHEEVFACSIGDRPISYQGHVRMMAAVQPFLSGAISKTVNLPESATVDQVEQLMIDAWRSGIKALAIYRDNCKVAQPLMVGSGPSESSAGGIILREAVRRELPQQRSAKTFKFVVGGVKGFVTVGEFDDGSPGEIFINISKQGSTLAGIVDSLAISISYGLQYGVPLKSYIRIFLNMTFAPSGVTNDSQIKRASSIIDFIARKLAAIYLSYEDQVDLNLARPNPVSVPSDDLTTEPESKLASDPNQLSLVTESPLKTKKSSSRDFVGTMCSFCGNQTHRSGSCLVCDLCGQTSGCS